MFLHCAFNPHGDGTHGSLTTGGTKAGGGAIKKCVNKKSGSKFNTYLRGIE